MGGIIKMANIKESFRILQRLEFSSPENALEKNPTESGYTFMGIYQTAWPQWEGWKLVREALSKYNNQRALASQMLYQSAIMQELVYSFYKKIFWDVASLDEISQRKADEIFLMGVNAGISTAVKMAQSLVGVEADGKIGPRTVRALNAFSDDEFDVQYDELEKAHYAAIIERNPAKKIFANGWRNRADAV